MTKKTAHLIIRIVGIVCFQLVYGLLAILIAIPIIKKDTIKEYFVDDTQKYLNGLKLDIPSEITQLSTLSDTTVDLLASYIDTTTNVVSLGFSGKAMLKDTYMFIPEHGKIFVDTDSVLDHTIVDADSLVRQKYEVKP